MTIDQTSNTLYTAPNSRLTPKQLTTSDFLNLMLQQLKNQDPTKPQDSTTMLTQMSQISTVQSMTAMQTSLTTMKFEQDLNIGQGLVGKTVTVNDGTHGDVTGTVSKLNVGADSVTFTVNGLDYAISSIKTITPGS